MLLLLIDGGTCFYSCSLILDLKFLNKVLRLRFFFGTDGWREECAASCVVDDSALELFCCTCSLWQISKVHFLLNRQQLDFL